MVSITNRYTYYMLLYRPRYLPAHLHICLLPVGYNCCYAMLWFLYQGDVDSWTRKVISTLSSVLGLPSSSCFAGCVISARDMSSNKSPVSSTLSTSLLLPDWTIFSRPNNHSLGYCRLLPLETFQQLSCLEIHLGYVNTGPLSSRDIPDENKTKLGLSPFVQSWWRFHQGSPSRTGTRI